jgi:UDP-galactose-lipid carrier transferase
MNLLKLLSVLRGQMGSLVCNILLASSDALAWFLVYRIVAESSQMAAVKFAIMAAAWCAWAALVSRQYSHRYPFWTELGMIFRGVLMLAFVGSMLKALIGNSDSLLAWMNACLLLAFALPLFRWLTRVVLRRCGLWNWPTLVFGGGENARQAVLALRAEDDMGYKVHGIVMHRGMKASSNLLALGCPVLTWPESAIDFELFRGYHCVVALEAQEFELRDKLIRQLSEYQVRGLHVIPAMRGVPLFGLATTNFFSHEVLMIHVRNNLSSYMSRTLKRMFDVVGATCLLILLSPLMGWVSWRIWRSDGFPVIFSQSRVGRSVEEFEFYKFRSMVKNAEVILKQWESSNSPEWQEYVANNFKLSDDPRLISIGAMIRRTSIDELPQLLNVIKGDMSLVGPRPLIPRELHDYGEDLSLYAQTRPGLTGLWQISGRSETTFEDRIIFDVWYVKNWSIWTDVTILFKTLIVVFGRRGAY